MKIVENCTIIGICYILLILLWLAHSRALEFLD